MDEMGNSNDTAIAFLTLFSCHLQSIGQWIAPPRLLSVPELAKFNPDHWETIFDDSKSNKLLCWGRGCIR